MAVDYQVSPEREAVREKIEEILKRLNGLTIPRNDMDTRFCRVDHGKGKPKTVMLYVADCSLFRQEILVDTFSRAPKSYQCPDENTATPEEVTTTSVNLEKGILYFQVGPGTTRSVNHLELLRYKLEAGNSIIKKDPEYVEKLAAKEKKLRAEASAKLLEAKLELRSGKLSQETARSLIDQVVEYSALTIDTLFNAQQFIERIQPVIRRFNSTAHASTLINDFETEPHYITLEKVLANVTEKCASKLTENDVTDFCERAGFVTTADLKELNLYDRNQARAAIERSIQQYNKDPHKWLKTREELHEKRRTQRLNYIDTRQKVLDNCAAEEANVVKSMLDFAALCVRYNEEHRKIAGRFYSLIYDSCVKQGIDVQTVSIAELTGEKNVVLTH